MYLSRNSAPEMTALTSAATLLTTGRGTAACESQPNQAPDSKPGSPDSDIVGTSGSVGERSRPPKASAFTRPCRIKGRAGCRPVMENEIWFPIRALRMSGPPLYGTCVTLMPASALSASVSTCGELPSPKLP